jgi:hypothetical protein
LILFLLAGVISLSIALWLANKTRDLIRRGAHAQSRYIDGQWRGSASWARSGWRNDARF